MQPPSDTDPVRCMKPEPAILGGDITLTCILSQHMEAFQVTWCEIKGNKSKDLASFSKIYGPLVKQEFSAFISIAPLDPDEYFNRSTIEILKWEKEDEACYGCYFNINHAEGVPGDVFLADIGRLDLELFMSLDQGWTLPGFQKTLLGDRIIVSHCPLSPMFPLPALSTLHALITTISLLFPCAAFLFLMPALSTCFIRCHNIPFPLYPSLLSVGCTPFSPILV